MTVTRCPHSGCGKRMWAYDSFLFTCKNGHRMRQDHVLAPAVGVGGANAGPEDFGPSIVEVEKVVEVVRHAKTPYLVALVVVLAQIAELVL